MIGIVPTNSAKPITFPLRAKGSGSKMNLILKSHKFHIFVIKRSVLGILHGNLSTQARQLTPKITAFDKSK